MTLLGACGVLAGAFAFGIGTVLVWRAAEAAAGFYNRKRYELEMARLAWDDDQWGESFTDQWLDEFLTEWEWEDSWA